MSAKERERKSEGKVENKNKENKERNKAKTYIEQIEEQRNSVKSQILKHL